MIQNIAGALPLTPANGLSARAQPIGGESDNESFSGVLADAVDQAHTKEAEASKLQARFAAGDPAVGIQEVMIAQEKAAISVRYAVTLKNRAIEAYRELMNTQV